MTGSAAARGCARPIADIRAPRPLDKYGAPPRSRSHRRWPSDDPEPLEFLGLPYQVSLTIAVEFEPSCHALWPGTGLPDGAGGPFPARRLSGREGSVSALDNFLETNVCYSSWVLQWCPSGSGQHRTSGNPLDRSQRHRICRFGPGAAAAAASGWNATFALAHHDGASGRRSRHDTKRTAARL